MDWTVPRATVVSIKRGQSGIVVWSLQKALAIEADGLFGPATEFAVKAFQAGAKLVSDGIAGPVTQRAIVTRSCAKADDQIPAGLLDGFAQAEGGYLLGPVNWSVGGGVDCGAFQRRVYDEDYENDAVIQRAFDTDYQARLLAASLASLRGIFVARAGTKDGYGGLSPAEKAWRLAALNHNYPSGADRLSRTPVHQLASYWTTTQQWVVDATTFKRADGSTYRAKFPDGTVLNTPLQWCHRYAGVLGANKYGTSGAVTALCSNWP